MESLWSNPIKENKWMKRIISLLCIIVVCSVLSACGNSLDNEIHSKESANLQSDRFDYSTLYIYIGITREEVINKLGDNYEEVETGPEGSLTGLLYSDIDLEFALDDGKVIIIYCGEKVEFNGARAGMNFKQLQERLGKGAIEKTWYETPENIAYKTSYIFDNNVLTFLSFEEDGSNSWLWIEGKIAN
jgi:hypothetical protein